MIFGGFLPKIWSKSKEISEALLPGALGEGLLPKLAIFELINIGIRSLTALPFEYYFNFVLEARHGFNKMTTGTFISDYLKTVIMNGLSSPLINFGALWIVENGGPNFHKYLMLFGTGCLFGFTLIYPNFIQPLFNKFEVLGKGENLLEGEVELRERIEKIAKEINFPAKEILKMNASERSGHGNAYYFGYYKNQRIVIYDTLIKQCSNDEIEAIIMHELGHWHYNHNVQSLMVTALNIAGICYALKFTVYNEDIYKAFGFPKEAFLGFSLMGFLIGPVSLFVE